MTFIELPESGKLINIEQFLSWNMRLKTVLLT